MKSRWLPFFVLSCIVLTLLSCAMVDRALNRETALPQDQVIGSEPTEEGGQVEVAPTEGPKRLEFAPTPTPLVVSEDDPRAFLDLEHPDHVDYFDNPDAWFDYDNAERAAYKVEDGMLHWNGLRAGREDDLVDLHRQILRQSVRRGQRHQRRLHRPQLDGHGHPCGQCHGAGGYSLEVACDGEYRFRRAFPKGQPD